MIISSKDPLIQLLASVNSPVGVIQIAPTMINQLIPVDVQTMKGNKRLSHEEAKRRTKIDPKKERKKKSTHHMINITAIETVMSVRNKDDLTIVLLLHFKRVREVITMQVEVTSGTKIYPT